MELYHHGIKGQKWGVRNGPPYPLDRKDNARINTRNIDMGQRAAQGILVKFGSQPANMPLDMRLRHKKNYQIKHSVKAIRDDAKRVNPTVNLNNCTACSAAYDLRRRGYDVCARPFAEPVGYDIVNTYYKKTKWDMGGSDKNNLPTKPWKSEMSAEESYSALTKQITSHGEGARGLFVAFYKRRPGQTHYPGGHCIAWEVLNGQALFIDGQVGLVCSQKQILSYLKECDSGTFKATPRNKIQKQSRTAIRKCCAELPV